MGPINENIRNYRTFRGIKQQELADMLGKSKSVISNWERGENSPDVEICAQLCKILKITPNELFGWQRNKEYEQWLFQQEALLSDIRAMEKQRNNLDQNIAEAYMRLERLRGDDK